MEKITIEKNEVTRKGYQELYFKKTGKTITLARVGQMIKEGLLKTRRVERLNLLLIVVEDEEMQAILAEKIQFSENIFEYSYQDLGNLFAKTFAKLQEEREALETLVKEVEEKASLEKERSNAETIILNEEILTLREDVRKTRLELEGMVEENNKLLEEIKKTQEALEEKDLALEKTTMEAEREKARLQALLESLESEKETLVIQAAQSEKGFREEIAVLKMKNESFAGENSRLEKEVSVALQELAISKMNHTAEKRRRVELEGQASHLQAQIKKLEGKNNVEEVGRKELQKSLEMLAELIREANVKRTETQERGGDIKQQDDGKH